MSEERLTRFARTLRAEGLPVGTGRVADFCRAAALLPPGDLYWAGRATLVARAGDIPVYDAAFEAFFGPPAEMRPQRAVVRIRVEGETETAFASPIELLREKSFALCSETELAELGRMMRKLPLVVPERRSRRRDPARRGAPDLRRTLRPPSGRAATRSSGPGGNGAACAGRSSSSSTSRAPWIPTHGRS